MANIVDAKVCSVSFSIYSDAEIKALSVKRIVKYPALDSQGLAVEEGLYDPCMGPLGFDEVCVTCGLVSRFCPGHPGHIELPVPVVNAMLVPTVYRILRMLCLNCHNFCVTDGKAWKLDATVLQLRLIEKGLVIEAADITSRESFERASRIYTAEYLSGLPSAAGTSVDTIMAQKIKAHVIESLMGKRATRCSFCGAVSPGLRKFGSEGSIYCKKMEMSQLTRNAKNGVKIEDNVFDQPQYGYETRSAGALAAIDSCLEQRWISPLELEEHFRRAWAQNPTLCSLVWHHTADGWNDQVPTSSSSFFLRCILVPPNRFRPTTKLQQGAGTGGGSGIGEHPHNMNLNQVLALVDQMAKLNQENRKTEDASSSSGSSSSEEDDDGGDDVSTIRKRPRGTATTTYKRTNLATLWIQLQGLVGSFVSNTANTDNTGKPSFAGVKQLLEKKEGLFRRNMMGKRVNFAARTVISPDPLLETDEIGIPLVFATRLTFPTRVTPLNHAAMVQAVINGADVHPGATSVTIKRKTMVLHKMERSARVALSRNLLTHDPTHPEETALVQAHVKDGDMVLVNRQPSLHKPSMMGHRVKVLGKERTLRMHYANCKTYNADFDGDEMNVHLPQTHEAGSDLRHVAANTHQYLGPKDGEPLRGLIQDHVLAGTLLTMRDQFFTRGDYQLLLYGALHSVRSHMDIEVDPPCIFKPIPLWSGKQVVSALLKHLLWGKPAFNYRGATRVKWGDEYEDVVVFRGSELLTGVIDKTQSGPSVNGFVHACYQLYGGDIAERILSCLGRVFTLFFQMHAFTCGMEDFLLTPKAERERKQALASVKSASNVAMRDFLRAHASGMNVPEDASELELSQLLQEHLEKSPEDEARLDNAMKQVSHGLTSRIVKAALPNGLLKPFPRNNFYMMVVSGAKGTDVNFSMIACCLGQMELEGRRVARLVSGRTLASFKPFEVDVVAGGFIGQRFLTGIKPQEYYFHCMAGREGLVDTAVKTSRSGYLQRCIIKHMETLVVAYDGTVRDSDGSIVQFQYGDDGLDPTHYRATTNTKLWRYNVPILRRRVAVAAHVLPADFQREVREYHARAAAQRDRRTLRFCAPCTPGLASDRFLEKLELEKDWPKASEEREFRRLMLLNYVKGLCQPGEAVGVLAGQSIGEPSTQMTLNTFHLAGHGNVNVTLGIPRLRELLMIGGHPKLPSMAVPFLAGATEAQMETAKASWSNASFSTIFSESVIRKQLPLGAACFTDTIYLKLRENLKLAMTWKQITRVVATEFVLRLIAQIRLDLRRKKVYNAVKADSASGNKQGGEGEDDKDGEEGNEDEEEEDDDQEKRQRDGDDEDDEDDDNVGGKKNSDQDEDSNDENVKNSNRKKKKKRNSNKEEEAAASDQILAEEEGFVEHRVPDKVLKDIQGVSVESIASLHSTSEKVVRIVIRSSASGDQILMSSILEAVLKKQLVRQLPGINRAVFQDATNNAPPTMVTEGANVLLLARWGNMMDLLKIKCNDITHILQWYGVEAARCALVEEIAAVFSGYGISVGYRHLALIADYMTFQGEFRAFNRHAITFGKDSAFLKMSFETTANFAVQAAVAGSTDPLTSASGELVLGLVPRVGTGYLSVLQPLELPTKMKKSL